MDGYDLQQAVRPFVRFIDHLTNWYIRRSRRRFWKSTDDDDKAQAYATLYEVLLRLSKIAAPFVPFISEAIYRNLRTSDLPESVHLCDFPTSDGHGRDIDLEAQMEDVMAAVSLGRQLRADHNLKVRQPLLGIHVVCRDLPRLERIKALGNVIGDELNVKHVWFDANESDLALFSGKPNFSRLGPRLGPLVKKAAVVIQKLDPEFLNRLLDGKTISIQIEGQVVELGSDDVIVERKPKEGIVVASLNNLVVALETDLTQDLIREGLAREFVHNIQSMRKVADLDVTQRIRIVYRGGDSVREAVEEYKEYIEAETLCLESVYSQDLPVETNAWDLNGHPCSIWIDKA